jgi:hypothetical protein
MFSVYCFLFSVSGGWGFGFLPKTENRKQLFERFGLFDEHDGDIVLDFIEEATLLADEAVFLLGQPKVALALGAGQDFQQFFIDGHNSPGIKVSSD